MTILLRAVFCVALASASLVATPALAQSASATTPLRVRLMQGVATPLVDTNGYAMKPAVRDEMVQAFIKQISSAGLSVSSDGVPTRIVLNAYKERSTEDRLILGGMGGRDHMSVTVFVGETSFQLSHSGFASMNNIDAVAMRIGTEAGDKVVHLAGQHEAK